MKEMKSRDKTVEYIRSQRDGSEVEKLLKEQVHHKLRPPVVTPQYLAEELDMDLEEVKEELEELERVYSVDVSDADRVYF